MANKVVERKSFDITIITTKTVKFCDTHSILAESEEQAMEILESRSKYSYVDQNESRTGQVMNEKIEISVKESEIPQA